MGFRSVEGLPGMVYVPDETVKRKKKYPCPDCFECMFCDDDRCDLCLGKMKKIRDTGCSRSCFQANPSLTETGNDK